MTRRVFPEYCDCEIWAFFRVYSVYWRFLLRFALQIEVENIFFCFCKVASFVLFRCSGLSVNVYVSLLPQTDKLDIAVGYITSDSLIELQKAVELNHVQKLNLIIGMHYIEQFTQVEYKSAVKLNEFLRDNGAGEVRLVTPFRYHGKLYSFQKGNTAFAGITTILVMVSEWKKELTPKTG